MHGWSAVGLFALPLASWFVAFDVGLFGACRPGDPARVRGAPGAAGRRVLRGAVAERRLESPLAESRGDPVPAGSKLSQYTAELA